MKFQEWEPFYKEILNDFSFSLHDDIKSAEILNSKLENLNICKKEYIQKIIKNKNVIVFGAGPSIEEFLDMYNHSLSEKTIVITADGATTAVLEKEIVPDFIVTDLDGNVSDQIKANQLGSIVLVHAHGDNIDKIKKYSNKFEGRIVGTTQTNPELYNNLHNFGGFTDGDRAVFFADYMNAKKIFLVGFDFYSKIGKYSFGIKKNIIMKKKKLEWAKKLIDTLLKKDHIIYL
jgi:uncharacterized Rossmann fold enzyme